MCTNRNKWTTPEGLGNQAFRRSYVTLISEVTNDRRLRSCQHRWPILEAQQASLRAAGAERIFSEKISGAVTDRKALAKALAALQTGDVLLVTRLDRLARSTRDLLNILDTISKAGAKFRSLADAWADTTTPHGELMITILAGLATFERHLIRARTDEGRKRAQARGVRFGRPLKLSAFQITEALARREAGENLTDIGRSYGVSHSTISRL